MADISNIPFKNKLYDTEKRPPGSAIDQHWRKKIIHNIFKGKRRNPAPKDFKFYDQYFLLEHFNLRSFEYGNWLSQEDRYIYLAGFAFAMNDLSTVINVPCSKLGFNGMLNICFGSRGMANSLAHFEPSKFLINITRHREGMSYYSSGSGSLGHEWGHALDFYAGNYLSKSFYRYASDNIKKGKRPSGITGLYYDYMQALCGKNEGGIYVKPTKFYADLEKYVNSKHSGSKREYYLSNIEIFARSMEVYLSYKCAQKGIVEFYLKDAKSKYENPYYPTYDQIKQVSPLMDELITETMKRVK